ncbi:hypothetical protein ACFX2A_000863 [Malus domestica]
MRVLGHIQARKSPPVTAVPRAVLTTESARHGEVSSWESGWWRVVARVLMVGRRLGDGGLGNGARKESETERKVWIGGGCHQLA